MSLDWPTAETACSVAGSLGRGPPPMADHPAAIAPELTMTTLWPRLRSSTTWAHNLPTDAASTPPSPLVIDEDPTLTTTVRAVPGAATGAARPVTCVPPGRAAFAGAREPVGHPRRRRSRPRACR